MNDRPDLEFKFRLLLKTIPVTCRYFTGDGQMCEVTGDYIPEDPRDYQCHVACNCYGDINKCDLPEKYDCYLVQCGGGFEMSDKCKDRPHRWSKWYFAAYIETGGAIEDRRCKRCGKSEHRNISQVRN